VNLLGTPASRWLSEATGGRFAAETAACPGASLCAGLNSDKKLFHRFENAKPCEKASEPCSEADIWTSAPEQENMFEGCLTSISTQR
jgi:hypothetical protein